MGGVSTAQLVQPLSNGSLEQKQKTNNDSNKAVVQKLATEPGIYLANSMNSLRLEGQKTIAIEIVQQFDWHVPDWVVIPGGNLGNVSALGAGFTMLYELGLIQKLPRIAVAQAQRANPLFQAYMRGFDGLQPVQAQRTLASAIQIGNPVSYERAVRTLRKFDGVVEQATESELADAAARGDLTGMFNDPHTGVALAVLEKLVAKKTIKPNDEVVVISTATGLKFIDFKVRYHEGTLGDYGIESQRPNRPVQLPASIEHVKRAVMTHLERAELPRQAKGPLVETGSAAPMAGDRTSVPR